MRIVPPTECPMTIARARALPTRFEARLSTPRNRDRPRWASPAYEIRYPVMPNEADPDYAVWKGALQTEFAALEPGAIVIGHSVGGTILIHVLAEAAPPSSWRRSA